MQVLTMFKMCTL